MFINAIVFAVQILAALMVVFIVHEGGHLLAARLFRVRVAEISFGFGRKIWGKTDRHGTHWAVRLLPFSGFVQLSDQKEGGIDEFSRAPLWRRVCIVAAGPLSNIAFALMLLTVFYNLFGLPSAPPVITGIQTGSAAEKTGFMIGDRILSIDGLPISRFEDLSAFLDDRPNLPLRIALARNGNPVTIDVLPDWIPDEDKKKKGQYRNRIGILGVHKPLGLSIIKNVNGQAVGTESEARKLLMPLRGQKAKISFETYGDVVREFTFQLNAGMNANMDNPFTMDYHRVYPGQSSAYIYLQRGFARSAIDAFKTGGAMIKGTFDAFVHPFAKQKDKMRLDVPVGNDQLSAFPRFHTFIYCLAFLSVLIGFMNVLIIPGFDGYMLLLYATEAWVGKENLGLFYPRVWFASLFVLLAVVGILNLGIGKE